MTKKKGIEKGFFEAMKIEPKYQDRCALEDRCKEQGLPWSEVEKRCPHKMNCTDDCVDAYDFAVYPPITPEIVLGLEEIIIEKFGDIYWDKKGIHKDGYKMYRCKCTLQSNEISAMWAVGKTKKDTLIDLCRYLKNDGIQDQVKALFNA